MIERIDTRGWQHVDAARTRIAALVAWRRGSAVVASLCAAALVAGSFGTVGPLAGILIALSIMAGAHLSLHAFVGRCALSAELAEIPAVASRRRRLCSARKRHELGTALRSLVSASAWEKKNPYVLWDRVSLVADELMALADELEYAEGVDPRTIVEVDRLLCDGRESPMLNAQLPASELSSTLLRMRFRLLLKDR
jgi:hypothetical protein